jgi:hypothetical protein
MHIILSTWEAEIRKIKIQVSPVKSSKTLSQSTTEPSSTFLSPQAPQVSQIGRITVPCQPGDRDGHDTLFKWRKVEHGGKCL